MSRLTFNKVHPTHIYAHASVWMPSQLRRLQLRSMSCVPGSASSDEHDTMHVRIRKSDLPVLGDSERDLREVDMYARCARSEALQLRLRSVLRVQLKDGSTLDFTVMAIHVRPALSRTSRLVRSCILSGYVANVSLAHVPTSTTGT